MIIPATKSEITAILNKLGISVPAKKAARKVIAGIRHSGLFWIAVRDGQAFLTNGETAIIVPTKSPDQNIPLSSAVVNVDAVGDRVEDILWYLERDAFTRFESYCLIGSTP